MPTVFGQTKPSLCNKKNTENIEFCCNCIGLLFSPLISFQEQKNVIFGFSIEFTKKIQVHTILQR